MGASGATGNSVPTTPSDYRTGAVFQGNGPGEENIYPLSADNLGARNLSKQDRWLGRKYRFNPKFAAAAKAATRKAFGR